jgi:RNA polymerase sigma factor (sigma-70 family)
MPVDREPWVEPELPAALSRLSEKQRVVVILIHCFEWTQAEVAELLGVSKSTVQNHLERGLAKLRHKLGVQA